MIGAAGELNRALDNPAIQADVGLQAADAIAILKRRSAAGQLSNVVVVHIGTNGNFSAEQFDEMMRVLADVRKVVFVNVKAPRPWEQPNNIMLATGCDAIATLCSSIGMLRAPTGPSSSWKTGFISNPKVSVCTLT